MLNAHYFGKLYDPEQLIQISSEHRQFCIELLKGTFLSYYIFPFLICTQFYGILPNPIMFGWLAAHLILNTARTYFVFGWYVKSTHPKRHKILDYGVLASSFLAALLWISFMFVTDINEHPIETLFFYICTFGLTSGSVGVGGYWPLYYLNYMGTLLLGFFIHVLTMYTEPQYYLAACIILYGGFLVHICLSFNKKSAELIVLQQQNAQLAQRYSEQQKEAEKIADSRKILLAATSHDLRQPLQAMHLFLAAMSQNKDDPALLEQCINSAEGMTELLDRMLDLSKLESDTLEVHKKDFSLREILLKLENLHTLQAQDKGLALNMARCETIIHTDDILLERILSNVLSNAIKYTETGLILVSTAQHRDDLLSIQIKDSGPGLSEKDLSIVFKEFTQLHNPERDRKKGLGLGLSIVHRLSSLLGLSINLDSTLGEGTTFTIDVPIAKNQTILNVEETTHTDLDVSKKTIAIIDDDIDILTALETLLTSWGANVVSADSAQTSLEQLTQLNCCPDLIISDFRLRESKTGVDAIRLLKSHWPNTDIPAFLLSGDTAPEQLTFVKEQGLELLHKPIRPAQLRALLKRCITL